MFTIVSDHLLVGMDVFYLFAESEQDKVTIGFPASSTAS